MRFTNTEILLRNRRVFARARDEAFAAAARLLDDVIAQSEAEGPSAKLKDVMAALVDKLFHARYYARLSAGGNNLVPPPEVEDWERAYIDHVETMYSYSRSINRLLKHEVLMEDFAEDHPDVAADLATYLREIRKSDVNLIHENLHSMRERMVIFNRLMNRYADSPAAAGAPHS